MSSFLISNPNRPQSFENLPKPDFTPPRPLNVITNPSTMSEKTPDQFDKKVSSFLTQAQAINDEKAATRAAEAAKKQSATETAEAEAEVETSKKHLPTSQPEAKPSEKQKPSTSKGSRNSCVYAQPTQKDADSDDKDRDGSENPSTGPPNGKTFSWAMNLVRQQAEREHGERG
ncbi:MAG: hypothetical protein Q9226_008372 [Calogaya cf. arnoldii]